MLFRSVRSFCVRLYAQRIMAPGQESECPVVQKRSDTGNRTPGYRVRGDNVSHYTISDCFMKIPLCIYPVMCGIILIFRSAPEHRLLFFAFTIPEQVRCFVPQMHQQRIRVRSHDVAQSAVDCVSSACNPNGVKVGVLE